MTIFPSRSLATRRDVAGTGRLFDLLLCCALCSALAFAAPAAMAATDIPLYIGTYTSSKSQGIYFSRLNLQTGALTTPELAAPAKNPAFLALHPHRPFIYAVAELDSFEGRKTGAVSAFLIDPKSGKLQLLNQQPSGGSGPCHLALDQTGKCLLVANYGAGTIAALPVQNDGTLGPARALIQHTGSSVNPQRQSGPHAHFITTDPDNRLAMVCDLGLDQVLLYHLNPARAVLLPNETPYASLPAGAGPRHLVFLPNGRVVYVINEMGSSITSCRFDRKNGALEPFQTIGTLPPDFKGDSTCAEIQIHPSGRFVYASNRGHDSIALFQVEPRTFKLQPLGHQPTQGKTPRHFALSPNGKFLLAENQDSDSIVVFRSDAQTGRLTPAGQTVEVGSPVCIVFPSN